MRKISRDHSFPRHTEFLAKPRNLPISAEFLRVRVILRNSVLGQIRHILVGFRQPYRQLITV